MRSTSMRIVSFVAPVSLLLWSGLAAAQDPPPPPPPPPPQLGVAPAYGPPPGEARASDGLRIRVGFSADGGATIVQSQTAATFGGEARIGVQINNLVGVYGTPHFVVANAGGGVLGTIGVFAGTGDVDVTLFDHLYVGAGGGFGIVNSPSGPVLHLRLGGYPLVGKGENGYRRKGLQIGADFRAYFLSAPYGTATEITGGIGYEAF